MPEKLPKEVIEMIVAHARFSPSWTNSKTARYICLSDDKVKEQVANCCYSYNVGIGTQALHLVVMTAITGRSGTGSQVHTPMEWLMFDSGLAAQTFCLAAYALDVGTIILGSFDKEKIATILPIPEDQTIIAMIAMRRTTENPPAPHRKEIADILTVI